MAKILLGILILGLVGLVISPEGLDEFFIGLAGLVVIVLIWRFNEKSKIEDRAKQEAFIRALQIDDIDRMAGIDFEHYVQKLLIYRGYQTEVTPATGDVGADIIARANGIKYAIQAKRYSIDNRVGVHAVTEAIAALPYYDAEEAIVITSGYFTNAANRYAEKVGCRLVDRDELSIWVKQFQEDRDRPKKAAYIRTDIQASDVISLEDVRTGIRPWKSSDDVGFVIKTSKRPTEKATILHKCSCRHAGSMSLTRFNIWIPSLEKAEEWGRRQMRSLPKKCRKCLR
ncbi:MAG: restriction endonuclease [Chloroflexi bacterium]|nr:restriction endonuclease [Chloroflexota bacterium]